MAEVSQVKEIIVNAPTCAAHEYIVSGQEKLDALALKLSEGQQQLQIGLVKVTESMDGIRRLHGRLDKVEKTQETLKAFMWRITGILGAIATLPVVWQVFQIVDK